MWFMVLQRWKVEESRRIKENPMATNESEMFFQYHKRKKKVLLETEQSVTAS